jgi:hypothetical protein
MLPGDPEEWRDFREHTWREYLDFAPARRRGPARPASSELTQPRRCRSLGTLRLLDHATLGLRPRTHVGWHDGARSAAGPEIFRVERGLGQDPGRAPRSQDLDGQRGSGLRHVGVEVSDGETALEGVTVSPRGGRQGLVAPGDQAGPKSP